MSYSMRILLNDFAIRSFRETADKDYITARMAYRAWMMQPFLWSALHCLEKYVKCILVLNRVNSKKLRHTVLPGIRRMNESGKFKIELSADTYKFIKKLEDYGAEDRYYLTSYSIQEEEITRLDLAVWELRRYCQPLDYTVDMSGKAVSLLTHELDRIHQAKEKHEKGTCIMDGVLEKIIKNKGHPARNALIWNNPYFGPSRRKNVKLQSHEEFGNAPLFLHPEIIDEVIKYVQVPEEFADRVRQLAKQRAVEKAERDAKKAAKTIAKQLEKTG